MKLDGWSAVTVTVTATLCLLLFSVWRSRRRLRQLANEIPGPPTLPLLGNIHLFLGGPEKIFATLRDLMSEYQGRAFRMWLGPLLFVVVTRAEDIESIMTKHRLINRSRYLTKVLASFLGDGLILSRDEKWKKQRKIIAPTFQTKIVESYTEVFDKKTRILVEKLKMFADGRAFDVYDLLGLCTLDMICESSMGIDIKAQEDNDAVMAKTVKRMTRLMFERSVRPWLTFDTIYDLTAMGKEQKEGVKLLNEIGEKVISNKMKTYEESWGSTSVDGKKSFLDHYITSSANESTPVSKQQLRDEVHTIMVAGQETTATTMSFCLMMLGFYPQLQEEIYEELKDVFADDWERAVTSDDVRRMGRLDRFIKETMRIIPSVMLYSREVEKEVELSTCTLPAGARAIIPIYFIHRDPRYFPDPERFDPDRFLPERSKERHPCSYIPFGVGPRMCVGFKYAQIQIITTLASVLKTYRILPAMTYESLFKLELGLTPKPVSGFLVKMLPRKESPTLT